MNDIVNLPDKFKQMKVFSDWYSNNKNDILQIDLIRDCTDKYNILSFSCNIIYTDGNAIKNKPMIFTNHWIHISYNSKNCGDKQYVLLGVCSFSKNDILKKGLDISFIASRSLEQIHAEKQTDTYITSTEHPSFNDFNEICKHTHLYCYSLVTLPNHDDNFKIMEQMHPTFDSDACMISLEDLLCVPVFDVE